MNEAPLSESALAEENMGLVRAVVLRFSGRGMEYEDLVQIGSVGLLKAIRGYDPERGTRFSTYAFAMTAGEIRRALRDRGAIRVSRSVKRLAARIEALTEEAEKSGESPRLSDIAARLGADPSEAAAALCAVKPPVSIFRPADADSDSELKDVIPAEVSTEAEAVRRVFIEGLVSSLDDTEKSLVSMRFFSELTQKETAERLSMSQPRVSRLEAKILIKLRALAEK